MPIVARLPAGRQVYQFRHLGTTVTTAVPRQRHRGLARRTAMEPAFYRPKIQEQCTRSTAQDNAVGPLWKCNIHAKSRSCQPSAEEEERAEENYEKARLQHSPRDFYSALREEEAYETFQKSKPA